MTARARRGILIPPKKRRSHVTVCIAAIYNNNAIMGASDKMLSTDTVEYEPEAKEAKKIFILTKNMIILTAGSTSTHAKLLPKLHKFIKDRLNLDSSILLPVADVANHYQELYLELRKETAEKKYLYPQNLTSETFLEKQKSMAKKSVKELSEKLENFRFNYYEDIEAIITGIDGEGPHIFVQEGAQLTSYDNVGFAAVGSGAYHANSYLELKRHSKYTDGVTALIDVHRAKKKAQTSPGVGPLTDMIIIGPQINNFNWLEPSEQLKTDVIGKLDEFHDDYETKIRELDESYKPKIADFINQESQQQTDTSAQEQQEDTKVSDEVKTSEDVKVKVDEAKKEPPKGKGRKTD